ncbi:MAG: ATP-binding protein [Pseudonocardiaceae bacterium]
MTHPAVSWSLVELLRDGENSGVEFTRDDVQPHDLAKELVALSNLRGGRILLGVEDDGTISGLVRDAVEEWVLTIARDKVRPPLIPHVQTMTDPASGRRLAIVTVEAGYAVHAMWHNKHFSSYIRAGRQSREASPEELSRLQQQRGGFRAELRPISGTSYADLDQRRLADYFQRVRGQEVPDQADRQGWVQLLSATEFLVAGVSEPVPCLAAIERATLRGPLAPLMTRSGELVEPGLVDSAVAFVRRNVGVRAELVDGVRRVEIPGLPAEPVREALVNAVIHRDYLLAHTDVELGVYPDRLEIVSPGRLPNGVTVERMLAGTRAARNELLKDVMRDYGYLEHMGLGVPRKIVCGMREFNGSEPEFTVGEESLTVVLRR